MITVIWDTWLKPGTEREGLRLTRQVWSDMRSFDGYISHQIFIDQDDPGHIIALANWRNRADADAVREKYKDSEMIRQFTPLLARPGNDGRLAKITRREQSRPCTRPATELGLSGGPRRTPVSTTFTRVILTLVFTRIKLTSLFSNEVAL